MYLLHTSTFELHDFYDTQIPVYAILSHRWGDEEVLFDHIGKEMATRRKGWIKIRSCCELAASESIDYVWIDTCCIDKKSSAELSEAINSMWRYYTDAKVCYAYLVDVLHCTILSENICQNPFGRSSWFTRGWTLQELIAPAAVDFYSTEWKRLGTKQSLAHAISAITKIPAQYLDAQKAQACNIAQRMSFAAYRTTTRTEDLAYCLMGLMDVNMPLLYGEGNKAFRRLQEEIIRNTDDQTIFVWTDDEGNQQDLPSASNRTQTVGKKSTFRGDKILEKDPDSMSVFWTTPITLQHTLAQDFANVAEECHLLARSPNDFVNWPLVTKARLPHAQTPSYNIVNGRLSMRSPILIRRVSESSLRLLFNRHYRPDTDVYKAVLSARMDPSGPFVAMYLVQGTDGIFRRIRTNFLAYVDFDVKSSHPPFEEFVIAL